ncbi:hypothetical protein ACH5RR_013266 [Cinchona calisaya]|uniref:Uncharacterized protein n=1 Tax=Cinchona calisaya TaxID=153742 RepID=A0ABD2ZZI9_9GENT
MEKFIDSRVESLKQQPTEEDAMGFITYVKNFLSVKDDEYKFEELATALEDYNMLKIRVEDLIEIVHKIFEGHPMLFSRFQKLLPQETTTSIVYCTNRNIYSGSESKNQACKEYIETVKTRFENDPDVYYSFLTILDDYGKGEDNVVGVYRKIFDLFLDHEDLVKEFNYFLSDLDNNTREKIEEIKIWTKEDHLNKVQKLLLKVIEERKFLDKVYRFSNLVLENSNIDIDKHLKEKDVLKNYIVSRTKYLRRN